MHPGEVPNPSPRILGTPGRGPLRGRAPLPSDPWDGGEGAAHPSFVNETHSGAARPSPQILGTAGRGPCTPPSLTRPTTEGHTTPSPHRLNRGEARLLFA